MRPKRWCEKFKAVLNKITGGQEDVVSVNKYMIMCCDSKQSSKKQVTDGISIKRTTNINNSNQEFNGKYQETNNNKESKNWTTKMLLRMSERSLTTIIAQTSLSRGGSTTTITEIVQTFALI